MAAPAPVVVSAEPCVLGGDVVQLPKTSLVREKVFRHVFSDTTWRNVLPEEDRERLRKLLPPGEAKEQDAAVHKLFTLQNVKFGNPLKRFHKSLKRNHYNPENYYYRQLKRKSMYKAYKQKVLQQHTESLQILLLLRQKYLDGLNGMTEVDIAQKVNPKWRDTARTCLNLPASEVDGRAKALYSKVMRCVKRHCADDYGSLSEDEMEGSDEPIAEMQGILGAHYKRRLQKQIAPTLDTRGTTMVDVIDRVFNDKPDSEDESEVPPVATPVSAPPAKKAKLKVPSQSEKKPKPKPVKTEEVSMTPTSVSKSVSTSLVPYQNIVGLLKAIMASPQAPNGEMTDAEIAAEVNQWQLTDVARLCPWASLIPDWQLHINDVLTVLAERADTPLVIRTISDSWKWVKKAEDSKTKINSEWTRVAESVPALASLMGDIVNVRQVEELPESHHGESFQRQEALRFAYPHRCFTYKLDGREFLVGPVKGVYDKLTTQSNNKAREHVLLVNDRPSYVTILTLVRDAAARLPKGEGTRYEICELLKESQFISESASDHHINTVVSGALDRLHYEKDPCVKFDSARKNWVYLHGDRTADQLETLHQAQGAAAKAKKASKPNKNLQASNSAIVAANKPSSDYEKASPKLTASRSTSNPRSPAVKPPPPPDTGETELAAASIKDPNDSMADLLSQTTHLPAVPRHLTKVAAMAPLSHHMRAVKLEPGAAGEASRLIGIQMPRSQLSVGNQLRTAVSSGVHLSRQISAPVPSNADATIQRASHIRTPTETTPTLIHSSSLPKGAVFYQRISTPQGQQNAMMQKVLSAVPTQTAGKPISGKHMSAAAGSPTVMHRIVGNTGNPSVLARLVQTSGAQKISGGTSGQQQQQFTHLQLPGGDRYPINSKVLQIGSPTGSSPSRSGMLQVHNMGGTSRAVGSIPRTTVTTNKPTGQAPVSTQMKLSTLQQQLSSGKLVTATGNKGSLLSGQSDGKGNQVQLVKALISSAEGKSGSQAYILTSNSGQRQAVSTNKSSPGTKSAMIARVLQPDGTLTSVKPGRVNVTAGGKSILTSVTPSGVKKTPTPLIVRHISGQSSIVRTSMASGEIPKKIEQSELSPSTELDVESDA